MRKLKWATIVPDIIYIILGVIFIIRTEQVEDYLCYILAVALAVFGVLYLIGYFLQSPDKHGQREGNGFAFGILLIILAIFIVYKQVLVTSLVPFLFGVMVVFRGLMLIQSVFAMRYMNIKAPGPLSAGLITAAFGLFVMLFPFKTSSTLFVFIGIGLLIGGLAGFVIELVMWNRARNMEHELERARDMEGVETVQDVQEQELAKIEEPNKNEAAPAKAGPAFAKEAEAAKAAAEKD